MEEFVCHAIDTGFTAYGVSSHAPLPFPASWTLAQEQLPEYLSELDRLKVKYADRIELYAGLEIDYLNEEQNPAMDAFQALPLDYRIGSVHLIYTDRGEVIDTDTTPENFKRLLELHFKGDLQKMVNCYFDASIRMVQLGGIDFIGHADKIAYNADFCRQGVTAANWYRKKRDELFELIAEKGLRLEINTKAFLKKGCFFPSRQHFRQLRSLGIPVVVNSDAHRPEWINLGRYEALTALKEAGYRTVSEMHAGHWMEKEIAV